LAAVRPSTPGSVARYLHCFSARSDRGPRIRLQRQKSGSKPRVGGERQRRRAVAANRQQRSDAAEARNTDVNCVDSSFSEWPRADRIWLNWRRLPGTEPSTPPSRSHDGTRWLGKPGRFLRPGHYPLVSANSPGLRRGYFRCRSIGPEVA
jgi:hypothetical protein